MEYITSGCAAGTMIEYLHGNTNLANQKGETYHNARVGRTDGDRRKHPV